MSSTKVSLLGPGDGSPTSQAPFLLISQHFRRGLAGTKIAKVRGDPRIVGREDIVKAHGTTRALLAAAAAAFLVSLALPATADASHRPRFSHRYYRHYRSFGYYRPYGYYYSPYFWGGYYPYRYYGAYYGPYYYGPDYSAWHGAVRLEVKPEEAQVYVDGYYAGIVDDFDGIFQRLYLRPGRHDLEIRLRGYRTFRERLLVRSHQTYKIHHQMERLAPGEPEEPAPEPRPEYRDRERERERDREPIDRDEPEEAEERPAPEPLPPPRADVERAERPGPARVARFGTVTLRVQPSDAEVWIDGELWGALAGMEQVVLHLPAGRRLIRISRDGYQAFETELELRAGEDLPLNVKLAR